jgi:hypothetical protein
MSSAWAVRTAARIGHRAAAVTLHTGIPRPNPFAGKGLDDLAEAWQHAYDRAIHPSARPEADSG